MWVGMGRGGEESEGRVGVCACGWGGVEREVKGGWGVWVWAGRVGEGSEGRVGCVGVGGEGWRGK